MTMRGIARGRIIELEEPLPYAEGQAVNVSVEALSSAPPRGSGAAILQALRENAPIDSETMDEFDRIIKESRLPPSPGGIFDDLRDE